MNTYLEELEDLKSSFNFNINVWNIEYREIYIQFTKVKAFIEIIENKRKTLKRRIKSEISVIRHLCENVYEAALPLAYDLMQKARQLLNKIRLRIAYFIFLRICGKILKILIKKKRILHIYLALIIRQTYAHYS
jgi:hypothetical protein